MPNTTAPLTRSEIEEALPREKEYSLHDGRGLILRVMPNGTKFWLFNYAKPGMKARTNKGLGRYPEVTLSQARQKRLRAIKQLSMNIDPFENE